MRSSQGQASIELLAVLPLVLAVVALLLQAMIAGHAWMVLNQAAGAAARDLATAIARGEDGAVIARRSASQALPGAVGKEARVTVDGRRVTIARRMPVLPLFKSVAGNLPTLSGSAEFSQ